MLKRDKIKKADIVAINVNDIFVKYSNWKEDKMAETITQDNVMNYQDFKSLVSEWASKIGVRPKEIHMRDMKNKWASLSGTGRVTFNSELIEMEKRYSDYVIVHELLHMKVPNHGKLFKSLMYSFIPDWKNLAER